MSSTAAKVIAAVAIFLTIILAVLGYRVSRQYAESAQKAEAQVKQDQQTPRILAVVALRPLAAYKKIGKDDVALTEVTVAPRDYFTSLEDVVGKEPLVDVDQGAPVTRRYFAEGNVLAKSVPAGFQAVSVEVSDVIGVGSFVRPGDIVDVLVYIKNDQEVEKTQARVLLKDVRVLAYEDQLVDRPEGLKDDDKNKQQARRQRTAVLAVVEADTTRLMLGASMGQLRLSLHGLTPSGTEVASVGGDANVTASSVPAAAASASGEGLSAAVPAGPVPASFAVAEPQPTVGGLPPTLPANAATLKAEAEKKIPDKALTAQQLTHIELPPSERKKIVVREKITVYRSSEEKTVTP